jgi:hypothetical protein
MTATHPTFLLYAGNSWTLDAALHDSDGSALDLTGAKIFWRLRNSQKVVVIERTETDGIVVTNAPAGLCTINVPPTLTAPLPNGNYSDETYVEVAAFASTQAVGPVTVSSAGAMQTIDPCITLANLRQAQLDILTGARTSRVRIENYEVVYSEADMAALDRAIMKYDQLCAQQSGGKSRRYAMRGGAWPRRY